jgi:hypothetical protein
MKKLIVIVLILSLLGCALESINTIRKKYPEHKIYRIADDEYIAIKGNEIRYIETTFGEITRTYIVKEVIGYKEIF